MIIIKEDDKLYPGRLKEIKDHPKKLYALGDISLLNKVSLAIVGSRKYDNYGLEQTKKFASYLAEKGICIVSGLARGIDTIAHTYSKDKIGKTIAVIASGFNYIYPKENKKLVKEIIEHGGLLISEWLRFHNYYGIVIQNIKKPGIHCYSKRQIYLLVTI